jgi:hypothetical protein
MNWKNRQTIIKIFPQAIAFNDLLFIAISCGYNSAVDWNLGGGANSHQHFAFDGTQQVGLQA